MAYLSILSRRLVLDTGLNNTKLDKRPLTKLYNNIGQRLVEVNGELKILSRI
jgi:hypothetical protein